MKILIWACVLLGFSGCSFGAYLIWEPLGFLAAGCFLLAIGMDLSTTYWASMLPKNYSIKETYQLNEPSTRKPVVNSKGKSMSAATESLGDSGVSKAK